jgi:HEAT repeat protein
MPMFGPPNANKLKAKGDVPGLIKALGFKKDPLVRRDAAEALGQMGDARAVEPLLEVLTDPDRDVRIGAANALGQIGDLSAVEPLLGSLRDEDPGVREAAVGAFCRLGGALGEHFDSRAIAPLIESLKDGYAAVREGAAGALGKMGPPAVMPLLDALRDPDGAVRKGASEALVKIGAPAIEPLVATLGDPELRAMASTMLGQIHDVRAVEPLIATLRAESDPVRRAAAETLDLVGWTPDAGTSGAAYWAAKGQWQKCVEIGRPAVDSLIDALKHPDALIRQLAARGLGQIRDARAVEPLIASLKGREDVRAAAATALGEIDDERAVEPLIAAVKDPGANVRAAAARALGQLGDVRAVDRLIMGLRDHESVVRGAAAVALGEIGDVKAVEPLINALHGREDVRAAAASALGQIGDPRAVEPLIAALKDLRLCVAAAEALVKIGAPAAAPLVASLRDRTEVVRNAAAEALVVQIGAPAVGPLLAGLRDEEESVRQNSAGLLDRIGWAPDSAEAAATYWVARNKWANSIQLGAAAIGPLGVAARTWQSVPERCAAIAAIGDIRDPRGVDPLAAAMKDRAADVRKAVVLALGRIGDARAVEALIAALKDRAADVRRVAEDVLAKSNDPRAIKTIAAIRPRPIVPGPAPATEIAAPAASEPSPAHGVTGATADATTDVTPDATAVLPSWTPTHLVPITGIAYWAVPDGRAAPTGRLDASLDLVVETSLGAWAQVRAVNGWRGWVDGRLLVVRRG